MIANFENKESNITVSELFLEIYRNFNVSNQIDKMKIITKEELYLLLDACIDRHDEDDSTVQLNFSPFVEEIKEILKIQSGEDADDKVLKNLQDRISQTLICELKTQSGEDLPDPYTKEEVRDLKLNKIFDK
jgi:hypothetical protein